MLTLTEVVAIWDELPDFDDNPEPMEFETFIQAAAKAVDIENDIPGLNL